MSIFNNNPIQSLPKLLQASIPSSKESLEKLPFESSQNLLILFSDDQHDDQDDSEEFQQIDEMDKSLASLQKSLLDMRINTSSRDSLRKDHDTTFSDINDTHEQLREFTSNQSPWRKLRSAPISSHLAPGPSHAGPLAPSTSMAPYNLSLTPSHLPPAPMLKFGSEMIHKPLDKSSNSEIINDLNKQLTGYKLQIRFFKQFLQKLIEKRELNENDLDLGELNKLHDDLSPIAKVTSNSKLEIDYKRLNEEYNEIFNLNQDLYTNLETFERSIRDKEAEIKNLTQQIHNFNSIIDQIIQSIMKDTVLDQISQKSLSSSLEADIETKLQLILIELNKKLEYGSELSRKSSHTSSSVTVVDKEKQYEINNYIKTIHQLMSALEQLRNEFYDQNQIVSQMKQELSFEFEQSQMLKANNTSMQHNLDSLTEMINQIDDKEMESIKLENERLVKLNESMTKKFEEYQQIIDHLQTEVKDIQQLHDNNADISELNEELLQSHRDFNKLQEEYNELHDQYVKLKNDSSNTVSSLTNQLHQKSNDSSDLKATKLIQERLQQELNLSSEKQRILKAEKIRLTYKVESLTNDKISLQTTIQHLTDKITDMTVSDSQTSKNDDESLTRNINILQYQFMELLQFDALRFQKLLKSFNKIADDNSLKEPTRKINFMINQLMPHNGSSDSSIGEINPTDITTVKDYHKSIFNYFNKAVDVVVNDHIKLLLKENEESSQNVDYVNKLHKRIDELNKINDDLARLMDSSSFDLEASSSSPKTKLRIDELLRRWKAEREARVYENKEAEKRLRELEIENQRLRDLQ